MGSSSNKPIDISAAQVKAVPLSGGTMTGQLGFNISGQTEVMPFLVQMSQCIARPITIYDAKSIYGSGLVVQAGGTTIVGGGEAGTELMSALIKDGMDTDEEHAYVAADGNVYLCVNCQDVTKRKTFKFDSTGDATFPGNLAVAGTIYADAISGDIKVSSALMEKLTVTGTVPVNSSAVAVTINFKNTHSLYFAHYSPPTGGYNFTCAAYGMPAGVIGVYGGNSSLPSLYFTPNGTSFTGSISLSSKASKATSYSMVIYGIL